MNIAFAVINAILGIYQYFIDFSLGGLVTHNVYGDSILMSSGKILKRSTGLIGSPQNYSLYMGIMTIFALATLNKSKVKFMLTLIIVIGGILSGSRAYSVFIASTLVVYIIFKLKNKISIKRLVQINLLIILFILTYIVFNKNIEISENSTINRLFTLFNDWPALNIFIDNINDIKLIDLIFGKGLGYNERLVSMFLGNINEYRSVESYILSMLLQGGIFTIIAFICLYISVLIKCLRKKEYYSIGLIIAIFINMMVTPSINGLGMSFIVWGIFVNKYNNNEFTVGKL